MLLPLLTSLLAWPQDSIRVNTQLVQVSVVIEAKRGQSIDFTKDDFILTDNGKPQTIATFTAPTKSDAQSPALPPRVFSNRYERRTKNVSIILLDLLNTPQTQHSAAREQLTRALEKMQPNGNIAIYVLSSKLHVLHDFTEDYTHLAELLKAHKTKANAAIDLNPSSSGLSPNAATAGTPLDRMAADATAVMTESYAAQRSALTLAALEAIARHVNSVPGRKNLLWVSTGFPLNLTGTFRRRGQDQEVNQTARLLTDADIAIYPVHASGLESAPVDAAAAGAGRRQRQSAITAPINNDTMRTIADSTGGRVFLNRNELPDAIREAQRDEQSTFVLGFYPSEGQLDGKYHSLKVQLKRKGLDMRYRKGYYAIAPTDAPAQQVEANWKRAQINPLPETAIGLSVRADAASQPQPNSIRFLIGIDVANLRLITEGKQFVGAAEVVLVEESATGAQLRAVNDTIRLKLTEQQRQDLLRDGLVIVKVLTPLPETMQVRVLVADKRSGIIGSVSVPGIQKLRTP